MKEDQFLIIATGSNLGDRAAHLGEAKKILSASFDLVAESRIYESPAVDYLNQPDFYNQVLQFKLPKTEPTTVMQKLLLIEKEMGRTRDIPKGPRLIDLDIIFWGVNTYKNEIIEVPHPRCFERSFVILPLTELPAFSVLKKHFRFNLNFGNKAAPLS